MRRWLPVLVCLAACAGPGTPAPRVIGAVETLRVTEADLTLRARIDTGAAASSLHATDIRLEGRRAHFQLEDDRGTQRMLSAEVVDVAYVRSAHGTEPRPRVALHLALGDVTKRVRVSLRDRSAMEYKLLVGRDFLAGDFVVDVSKGDDPEPRD